MCLGKWIAWTQKNEEALIKLILIMLEKTSPYSKKHTFWQSTLNYFKTLIMYTVCWPLFQQLSKLLHQLIYSYLCLGGNCNKLIIFTK